MKIVGTRYNKEEHDKKILFFIIIIFILFLTLKLLTRKGEEGFWRCEKSEWIKFSQPSYPKSIVPCNKKISLPHNQKDCLGQGGVWKKQGPEPFETCNIKAKDRGNLCRDNEECEGLCQVTLTREELSQGMQGKFTKNVKFGQCSVWVVELGCQGIMKNGKVQVLCLD